MNNRLAGKRRVTAPTARVHFIKLHPAAFVPDYANPGDAGADLALINDVQLSPSSKQVLAPTGLAVAIPNGYVGLITPRSGLAVKQGVSIVNTPGVIDSGYRGELKIGLISHSSSRVWLNAGTRVAQLLIVPVVTAEFVEVDSLDETERSIGGFGSTGYDTHDLYSHTLDRGPENRDPFDFTD